MLGHDCENTAGVVDQSIPFPRSRRNSRPRHRYNNPHRNLDLRAARALRSAGRYIAHHDRTNGSPA